MYKKLLFKSKKIYCKFKKLINLKKNCNAHISYKKYVSEK